MPARHVETHPAVARVMLSYANENRLDEIVDREKGGGDGEERDGRVGAERDETGEQQQHQPLPPPPLTAAVGMRAERHEAEQDALGVASRFILAQGVMVSYEERKVEIGKVARGREVEEGYDKDGAWAVDSFLLSALIEVYAWLAA